MQRALERSWGVDETGSQRPGYQKVPEPARVVYPVQGGREYMEIIVSCMKAWSNQCIGHSGDKRDEPDAEHTIMRLLMIKSECGATVGLHFMLKELECCRH